mgnify:CR=1 FL=1
MESASHTAVINAKLTQFHIQDCQQELNKASTLLKESLDSFNNIERY